MGESKGKSLENVTDRSKKQSDVLAVRQTRTSTTTNRLASKQQRVGTPRNQCCATHVTHRCNLATRVHSATSTPPWTVTIHGVTYQQSVPTSLYLHLSHVEIYTALGCVQQETTFEDNDTDT